MIRLLSVLNGEVKCLIEVIHSNKIFYAAALGTLKRDFGNQLVIAYSRLFSVFDNAQTNTNYLFGLRQFY